MWVETGFFSESRHLSLSVQESSYGSPLTPPKRPKRKLPPKRRQERPVAAPKKRRKVHRVDQYSAETRRKKVSSKNLWWKCHFLGTTLSLFFSTWEFIPCFRLGFCSQNFCKCTEGHKGEQSLYFLLLLLISLFFKIQPSAGGNIRKICRKILPLLLNLLNYYKFCNML